MRGLVSVKFFHIVRLFGKIHAAVTKACIWRHVEGNIRDVRLIGKTSFRMADTAKIILDEGAALSLGCNSIAYGERPVWLRIDEGGVLHVKKKASLFYDDDIVIFAGGKLTIGNSYINSDCKIRCHNSIAIGDGCAISHDFTVMDSDAHEINGVRKTEEVIIGDHVWIGTRVTILPGVHVGDGAILAAGAVIKEDVPAHSVVGGCPARVIKEYAEWRE